MLKFVVQREVCYDGKWRDYMDYKSEGSAIAACRRLREERDNGWRGQSVRYRCIARMEIDMGEADKPNP